jgi:hypothetical protein
MNIFRKFVILIVFLMFSYILFRLLLQRVELYRNVEEGFTSDNNKVLSIKKNNNIVNNIENANENILTKRLKELYIKSAYGGGYDGTDITVDMIKYTLSLGYRYMVIHVFYDTVNNGTDGNKKKTAMVGFSSNFIPMTNSAQKTMSLENFIQIILENSFSSTSPNPGDPFFLHILPAYKKTSSKTDKNEIQETIAFNSQMNTQISQSLSELKRINRLAKTVNIDTTIDKLQDKLVIVMDADSSKGQMTDELKDVISFSVSTETLQSAKNLKIPVKNTWVEILPIDEDSSLLTNHIDYINKYRAYKMNVSPVCVWESRYIVSLLGSTSGKTNLGEYEELFSKEGSAFII